jgi:acetolactate synthase I/II/III large subunit
MSTKKNQKYITSGALATMGFSLPASIGVSVAMNNQPVVAITGDGSFQLNIQELQTIKYYNLPVKLFVVNNKGYLSIRQTQYRYFNGRMVGEGPSSGVSFPSIKRIAKTYGIDYYSIKSSIGLINNLETIIKSEGPFICEVKSIEDQETLPTTSTIIKPDGTLVSKPMEDMYPFLSRKEFRENMIVKPVDEE